MNNKNIINKFSLEADYTPSAEQQNAIDVISNNIVNKTPYQTLLGVTGSGKTFTMANIIKNIGFPTLIMTHNKTLSAQLYQEFKAYFPHNAVEYFVSYYDYYQPEAYVPSKDLYIDKDTAVNDDLDKLRLSATRSLFEREDVIIISSVSCIYGLGSPEAYSDMMLYLTQGVEIERNKIIAKLVEIRYSRSEYDFQRGTFRVHGDIIDIFLAYENVAIRIEMFGDEIETLSKIDPLTANIIEKVSHFPIYPASHYVAPKDDMPQTLKMIEKELESRIKEFKKYNKLVEAQRLEQRTTNDMEFLQVTGTCNGIENYSRIMTRRKEGEAPPTLIDYFPKNSLLFIDESHATIPQINGMYHGDRSRKQNLIDYGFRLPSALDNRPLKFQEFENAIEQCIYVSATPGDFELQKTHQFTVEQIIRPTGLLDPTISVRPVAGQVDDMYGEIIKVIQRKERILITTLTKRMAEDLTDFYKDTNIKARYLHSDIETLERTEIIRCLRKGDFDVLIGVNLLREGLDLPEVSLIGIFDADKEGFLRSHRSLLQICGRASRNKNGTVIMYGDRITRSMHNTIEETRRRRIIQEEYNKKHNIVPRTIQKRMYGSLVTKVETASVAGEETSKYGLLPKNIYKKIINLEKEMHQAARKLDFELAAQLRDEITYWKQYHIMN